MQRAGGGRDRAIPAASNFHQPVVQREFLADVRLADATAFARELEVIYGRQCCISPSAWSGTLAYKANFLC
jgi:hypothetical protein